MSSCPENIERNKAQRHLMRLFHKACAQYGLIEDGDYILIGLSGGKDSLALVELLGRRKRIFVPRFDAIAVHVRVKERQYIADTQYLQDFCHQWDIPLYVCDTEIKGEETKDPCFLCSWYRRKVLFDMAQEYNCNKIALGHHRDDILETMLMNLIFQGRFDTIRPKMQMDKMPLQMIRPLCLIPEAKLLQYAALSGYQTQPTTCPIEHVSSRFEARKLLEQMRVLNPNTDESMWQALNLQNFN